MPLIILLNAEIISDLHLESPPSRRMVERHVDRNLEILRLEQCCLFSTSSMSSIDDEQRTII
jgi:hypothetical protein